MSDLAAWRGPARLTAGPLLVLLATTALAVAVAPGAGAADAPWLIDVTAASGLDFVHVRSLERRWWLPEIMSGGACWLDYDRDGDLDLYLVQGGALAPDLVAVEGSEIPRDELYRNEGGGRFVRVTARAGLAPAAGESSYGMGCAVGDVDGDGWSDVYVTAVGRNRLYRNQGDGRFARRDDAGVDDPGWGASAAFVDYDADGDDDLFVVDYVGWSPHREVECYSGGLRDYCHPDRYAAPAPDRLFRNRGDGSFEDVSREAGLDAAFGNGLGVTVADLDEDGRLDVYVANDGMPNQLWRNRGDGTFEDTSLVAGVAVNRVGAPEAGMGVEAFDVDSDLDLDLFLSHLRDESNTLYVDLGGGLFMDRTASSGLGAPSLGVTGFGIGFVDFDADGEADLFVGNGRVGVGGALLADDAYAEPDHLYRGLGGGRFERLDAAAIGVDGPPRASRAAAFGDFDDDGAVDVLVASSGAAPRLLRNVAADGAAWLMVSVEKAPGWPAVGTSVVAEWDGRRRRRDVQPAYGYCTSNDPRVHFGLGAAAAVDGLEIRTPEGRRLRLRHLPARHLYVVPLGPIAAAGDDG